MGVDYIGYSCVRTEPIPAAYRPTVCEWTDDEKAEFVSAYKETADDIRPLILVLNGVSRNAYGEFIYPKKCEHPTSEDPLEEKEGVLAVCWDKNIVYYSTPETIDGSASRSYSGYADFAILIRSMTNPLAYMPPSTDAAPECGILNTDRCIECLHTLNSVRSHFVSGAWVPDPKKYGIETDHRFDDEHKKDNIHSDSWFFREFYSVMHLGANGGLVRIA